MKRLTARQQDCARLVAKGLLNSQIAAVLGIGVGTVKVYIDRAYERLQIDRRYNCRVLLARHMWNKEKCQ